MGKDVNTLANFKALITPVDGSTHVNVFGGTTRPNRCHDCGDVFDMFMVRDDLWTQALKRSPVREMRVRECLAALCEHLGRAETYDEKRRVETHFGVVLCLWCFAKRIDRHLIIPGDLKLGRDGRPLPINRPLLYAHTLGKGEGQPVNKECQRCICYGGGWLPGTNENADEANRAWLAGGPGPITRMHPQHGLGVRCPDCRGTGYLAGTGEDQPARGAESG